MLDLRDKTIKAIITNLFKELKESMIIKVKEDNASSNKENQWRDSTYKEQPNGNFVVKKYNGNKKNSLETLSRLHLGEEQDK